MTKAVMNEDFAKTEEFEGKEYLKKGDLTDIATVLNVHPRTVQQVYQGKMKSEFIAVAIKELISQRKIFLSQKMKQLAENGA
jgi:hypothetical protein